MMRASNSRESPSSMFVKPLLKSHHCLSVASLPELALAAVVDSAVYGHLFALFFVPDIFFGVYQPRTSLLIKTWPLSKNFRTNFSLTA